jgi:hypothetical protein
MTASDVNEALRLVAKDSTECPTPAYAMLHNLDTGRTASDWRLVIGPH